MEQRVSLVTLGVADLARSRSFYEGGLGWRPHFASDEVIFFQMNGFVLALWPLKDLIADAQILGSPGAGNVALAYNVRAREEVDAVLAEALTAGAKILRAAQDASWGGYSGYFADPDGHPWEVAWNPGWTITETGTIKL